MTCLLLLGLASAGQGPFDGDGPGFFFFSSPFSEQNGSSGLRLVRMVCRDWGLSTNDVSLGGHLLRSWVGLKVRLFELA